MWMLDAALWQKGPIAAKIYIPCQYGSSWIEHREYMIVTDKWSLPENQRLFNTSAYFDRGDEMVRFVCVLECVSQCGRGSLLTWLTHLTWLTNIKRANHISLLSTDSDVDSTQRVPSLSMLIDLQTEVRTKHCCLGESRPKEHHTVHHTPPCTT